MEEKLKAFERLLEIMDELREKCPWDREQTLDSLRNLTIEETAGMFQWKYLSRHLIVFCCGQFAQRLVLL